MVLVVVVESHMDLGSFRKSIDREEIFKKKITSFPCENTNN